MEIIILPDAEVASQYCAASVAEQVRKKPASVLGLATGSTPVRMYEELVRMHREEALSFAGCVTFNLDEYLGLAPDHPCSYRRFMEEQLFSGIDVKPENVHIPSGLATDIPDHCAAYEEAIQKAGGIDLQVLGIGSDGHIGFNEPSSSLASRTRIKTLTERTRKDNAHFFQNAEDVPIHVLTMGIGTIMEAKGILLLAFGEGKADAVAAAAEGPVTAMVPASILQMHQRATLVLDAAAASKLKRVDYYRWVFERKPAWQQVRAGSVQALQLLCL